ncbi:MAG: DNA polymerase III subunit gamma/tau [Acutalibacteraceae bacterium]
MYQVLYRKYRPRVFSDVVGQNHITSTLSNEIQSGKVSHAYLFTGSRGTGKTTCAKILSKAVNCLNPVNGNPCNECEICRGIDDGTIVDVVEIDAASNNGVDNIRDIREEINFTPAACKYRVYIIDEVHMLSMGAFNALLKTLEEPPAHVKFILATTEVHKLPVTIVSRCQRFDFKRVTPEAMAQRMELIADEEGLLVDSEAMSLIARIADGGMRDALSLLDQCTGHGKHITADIVCAVSGMAGKDHLFALADAVKNKDSAAALGIISDLHQNSCDMERLCSDAVAHFRNLMIVKTVSSPEGLVVCTDSELKQYKAQSEGFTLEGILKSIALLQECSANIKKGVNRRIETEMTFIRLCSPKLDSDNEAVLRRIADLEMKMESGGFTSKPRPAVKSILADYGKQHLESQSETPSDEQQADNPQRISTASFGSEPSITSSFAFEQETLPPPATDEREQFYADNSGAAASQGGGETLPWAEILSELAKVNAPLRGILTGSEAYINGDFVLIKSDNPTLSAFIKTGTNARDIKQSILRVTGKRYRLGLHTKKQETAGEAPKKDPLQDLISQAKSMNINVDIKP